MMDDAMRESWMVLMSKHDFFGRTVARKLPEKRRAEYLVRDGPGYMMESRKCQSRIIIAIFGLLVV